MKHISRYSDFLMKEAKLSDRRLILLSGPSATGKSTLANNLGATHWHEKMSKAVVVGTDDFSNRNAFGVMKSLCKDAGIPVLAGMMKDWPHVFDQYKKDFAKWRQAATTEEQAIFDDLSKRFPIDKAKDNAPHHHQDGRITGMAWVAALLPKECETVLFDDISVGIKRYFDVEEWVLFTPLDWLLKNIAARNLDENESVHIDVNAEGTAIYQYCQWWKASSEPDLDNKMYTAESVRTMLSAAGHNDPDEVLSLLGVKDLDNGFYLTTRDWIAAGSRIVNTRDKSTGRAGDLPGGLA
jgi:energy-coupling factor transporter ATP-binding protein EcfA2